MEIRITFDGGPLHGKIGHIDRLDDLLVFFPARDRQILCYHRYNETIYMYAAEKSKQMEAQYDQTVDLFQKRTPPYLRFDTKESVD